MSRLRFPRAPLSAAIILLTGSLAVHAVEEPTLEKIYISGTRSESAQLPLATTITVINQDQIRSSGATQIAEVLRVQAGIQIQDLDGSGGRNVTISMRGFSANAANNTLVMVDGRKLNNPSLAGPALNTIALKDVERIEIVQGSAGVLYGDQAVGGVINIVTRRAAAGELRGFVQAIGGSDNLESYTGSVSQGFSNGLSYSLSAQKRLADNYRDNNQSEYENYLGNVRYDFERGFVLVEGQKIDDKLRLPGALPDAVVAVTPRHTDSPNNYSNQSTELWRVGGGFNLTDTWQFLAEYADRDEDGEAFYDDYDTSDGYFPFLSQSRMQVKNFTPRFVGSYATRHGAAVITLGYDWVDSEYSTRDGFTHFTQQQDGIYGQVVYPLSAQLALTAGFRHATVEDEDLNANSTSDDDVNAGEVGLNYQISPTVRVFTRYAEGFRFANADENAFTPAGVDYLDVQTSESIEAGLGWSSDTASTTLTLYKMNIDNEIMFDSIGFVNINLPESERQGVMLDADIALSSQLALRANYTFTDAEQTSGAFDGNRVPFVAENTANLAVVFTFTPQVSAYVDANYTGSRYRVGDEGNVAPKVDAITVFNANLLWTIQDLELGFRIKNLTNEKYSDYQGFSAWSGNYQYPQPERNYEASLTYRF